MFGFQRLLNEGSLAGTILPLTLLHFFFQCGRQVSDFSKKLKRKIADAREFLPVASVLATIAAAVTGERKHLKKKINPYV